MKKNFRKRGSLETFYLKPLYNSVEILRIRLGLQEREDLHGVCNRDYSQEKHSYKISIKGNLETNSRQVK